MKEVGVAYVEHVIGPAPVEAAVDVLQLAIRGQVVVAGAVRVARQALSHLQRVAISGVH
jgi:hypothetical protein